MVLVALPLQGTSPRAFASSVTIKAQVPGNFLSQRRLQLGQAGAWGSERPGSRGHGRNQGPSEHHHGRKA
eukprot:1397063-Rhodomonas_salina.1